MSVDRSSKGRPVVVIGTRAAACALCSHAAKPASGRASRLPQRHRPRGLARARARAVCRSAGARMRHDPALPAAREFSSH
ncbi:hypothetical protein BURMUCGD1_3261 [Burkholderia multivorans CGD1]|nr:hypothetical protein BURMUCGD1_3261 [Burkholderia multivorans CGD1]